MEAKYYITPPYDWWWTYLIKCYQNDESSCIVELYDCFDTWIHEGGIKEYSEEEALKLIAWYDYKECGLAPPIIEEEELLLQIKSYSKYQFITQTNNELQLDVNMYIYLMKWCDDVIPDKFHPWRYYTNIYLKQ